MSRTNIGLEVWRSGRLEENPSETVSLPWTTAVEPMSKGLCCTNPLKAASSQSPTHLTRFSQRLMFWTELCPFSCCGDSRQLDLINKTAETTCTHTHTHTRTPHSIHLPTPLPGGKSRCVNISVSTPSVGYLFTRGCSLPWRDSWLCSSVLLCLPMK